jgi:hypothetical protein
MIGIKTLILGVLLLHGQRRRLQAAHELLCRHPASTARSIDPAFASMDLAFASMDPAFARLDFIARLNILQ